MLNLLLILRDLDSFNPQAMVHLWTVLEAVETVLGIVVVLVGLASTRWLNIRFKLLVLILDKQDLVIRSDLFFLAFIKLSQIILRGMLVTQLSLQRHVVLHAPRIFIRII